LQKKIALPLLSVLESLQKRASGGAKLLSLGIHMAEDIVLAGRTDYLLCGKARNVFGSPVPEENLSGIIGYIDSFFEKIEKGLKKSRILQNLVFHFPKSFL